MVFKGETTIQAHSADLRFQIDGQGRTWSLVADLLERYEFLFLWDASRRRILIGALDLTPIYRDDAVQASVGWPLAELPLQTGNALLILTCILWPGTDCDRAWCRVLEFAEEFGISVAFNPLVLAERWGG